MYQFSKHNILSKINGSEKYFIINQLSGNADIMESSEALRLSDIRDRNLIESEDAVIKELVEKGYLIDPAEEKKIFLKKYLDFLDSRETDEIQIFFVPNYSCNFSCSYCYQDQYVNPNSRFDNQVIDAFFSYIKKEFAGRRKYITVFGGEPLLEGNRQKDTISYLIDKSNKENIDLCFVTNGYTLELYLDLLVKGRVREIQVTLDGTAEFHNKRRPAKDGKASFDQIVKGIDACLNAGIPVNLRMVIDKENINNLPDFASFAIEKGWTAHPQFKTQFGRNYELHHCQSSPEKLFSRITMYEKISELIKLHPHILEFHKPAFSVTRFLAENGSLPEPLFDSCPACKTEWAFDYTGRIYSCTATVGKEDECLGTFFPSVSINSDQVEAWQSRDVTSVKECSGCNLQLACGGGCASVAKNNTGNICSPDCRPVKELLEMGFAHYF